MLHTHGQPGVQHIYRAAYYQLFPAGAELHAQLVLRWGNFMVMLFNRHAHISHNAYFRTNILA